MIELPREVGVLGKGDDIREAVFFIQEGAVVFSLPCECGL